jgi:hypothetical protein
MEESPASAKCKPQMEKLISYTTDTSAEDSNDLIKQLKLISLRGYLKTFYYIILLNWK